MSRDNPLSGVFGHKEPSAPKIQSGLPEVPLLGPRRPSAHSFNTFSSLEPSFFLLDVRDNPLSGVLGRRELSAPDSSGLPGIPPLGLEGPFYCLLNALSS